MTPTPPVEGHGRCAACGAEVTWGRVFGFCTTQCPMTQGGRWRTGVDYDHRDGVCPDHGRFRLLGLDRRIQLLACPALVTHPVRGPQRCRRPSASE